MTNLDGLKIALCQMPVTLGRPDQNTEYIVREIQGARAVGADIIVFPELCVTGYVIGDKFEQEEFVRSAEDLCNTAICKSTAGGITAIVGFPICNPVLRGEDGRMRLYNSAVIYSNGVYIGHAIKTLQPNYRMFDDTRHFFSKRKLVAETGANLEEIAQVFPINFKNGRVINVGLMLCEDMWHDDYPVNPGAILARAGAEIIINISASPWGWQKNRKRHSVIKELLAECRVPLVYVNNAGLQNNGKNLIVFDGSSTVYDDKGKIIFEMESYEKGTRTFAFSSNAPELPPREQDDSRELYLAVRNAIREFCSGFGKIVIGISGGIDSAVSAAAFVDALGSDKVLGVYMPFSPYSIGEDHERAGELARNLCIEFRIVPIDSTVKAIAMTCGVEEGTLEYENVQARARMEVLAAIAQKERGVFVCNSNKVETAFGYGTLYGDIAGALAPLADMVKREVYQLGDYLNKRVFGFNVIPLSCFSIAPSARLNKNQVDPFHYGNLERRGYHDEMVRTFTEFRLGPEWFLGKYLEEPGGKALERELKLEPGTIEKLFPSVCKFISDLERCWQFYHKAVFKAIQMPPILIVSKRAFGYDLRRSLLTPYFTARYRQLKELSLDKLPVRRVVYGGSFDPPGLHHLFCIGAALSSFDIVHVVPCGPRSEKESVNQIPLRYRHEMVELAFGKTPGVELDWRDLDSGKFTPTHELAKIYQELFPGDEIRFLIGSDWIVGGRNGKSKIQESWRQGERIWRDLNWVVIPRDVELISSEDLPIRSVVVGTETYFGSSSGIRQKVARGESIEKLVSPEIRDYIVANGLYK